MAKSHSTSSSAGPGSKSASVRANRRRKVLVTGASSGIGRATALRFAADGWDVCLNARREERLRELVKEFRRGDHLICAGSYESAAVIHRLELMLKETWGTLDTLVNCAGLGMPAAIIDSPLDNWRKPLDIMIEGAVRMTRLAVPL